VLAEHGLITVTGGKLTTFRRIARDTLAHAQDRLPRGWKAADDKVILPISEPPGNMDRLPVAVRQRLLAAFGTDLELLIDSAGVDELRVIPGTASVLAELRWAVRSEQVQHLDDLLLRRTRLGLTQHDGGTALLPNLRGILRDEAGWDDETWQREVQRYSELIKRCYSVPYE
jgi:glycerol-3-phosphate dehydrogenase